MALGINKIWVWSRDLTRRVGESELLFITHWLEKDQCVHLFIDGISAKFWSREIKEKCFLVYGYCELMSTAPRSFTPPSSTPKMPENASLECCD